MTGIAVVRLDHALPIGAGVLAVMASETTGPVFVANVVRINPPVRLHFGKEIVAINLLHDRDRFPDAGCAGVLVRQVRGNLLQSLRFVGVALSQHVHRIGLDVGQRSVDLAQLHRQIHSGVGGIEDVGRAIVAIHAVHDSNRGRVHSIGKSGGAKFRHYLVRVGHPNPGDLLARRICGEILDFLADVHVPVNASHRPVSGISRRP